MPPDQSVWRNDRDRIDYGRIEAVEPHDQYPIPVPQVWSAPGPAAKHVQLMAEDKNFSLKLETRLEQ